MANASNVKGNLDGLNELTRMLKEDYTLKVGIIGSKAREAHKESDKTNAEIGTFHEFGTEKMPQRSFLWMPLCFKLNFDKNPDMQEFKKILWRQFFIKKSPLEFYQALAEKAMATITASFLTNGFGFWKPLADSTRKRFESKMGIAGWENAKRISSFRKGLRISLDRNILVDTGQMKNSISFKISKRR